MGYKSIGKCHFFRIFAVMILLEPSIGLGHHENSTTTMRRTYTIALAAMMALGASSETFELLPFGDFNQWVTRKIPESPIIGGNTKTLYEVAPTRTINGAIAYSNMGGSPWATSNVYAKVMGVKKGSCAVEPDTRSGSDKCAKLLAKMDHIKAAGIVSMDVMVGGTMFLGKMYEPISSTSNPYKKMEMGIPFTKRPKALRLDYKALMPQGNTRTYSSGFGKKKTLQGRDKAEVFVLLQRRWEDADGKLYAKRVATGRKVFDKTTPQWVNGSDVAINYGDISDKAGSDGYVALYSGEKCYYAKNSKGKLMPVTEVGWDAPDATPTHAVVMVSASSGEPYTASEGLTLWVDNIGFVY